MARLVTDSDAIGYDAVGYDNVRVHDWRVERLIWLGVPLTLAEAYADQIDWHQVARLVRLGCPPRLALRIVR
jgi:hypothetical protein